MTADVIDIAFVVPESPPGGIYGPSCQANGLFAAAEVNKVGGILDREVRLHTIDGDRPPRQVADEAATMAELGLVDAVIGWHTSAVREALAPRLHGRVPYVFTNVYEGGERRPGVFLAGETPSSQILPAMRWMSRELGVRKWAIVGNTCVWPTSSAAAARAYADQVHAEVCAEAYVPLGTENFDWVVRRVEEARVQGVLMFLHGSDAVRFNRAFSRGWLPDDCVRLSPLMDENMLLATGAHNTQNLYSAAGFFEALGTACGLDFERRYLSAMGQAAPALSSPGESCYEGVNLYAQLAAAARTTDVSRITAVADLVSYEGPRGAVRMRNRHLVQRVYLARARGLEFDVLAEIHSGT